MKLSSILNPQLIFCRLAGKNRNEIYREMLRRASSALNLNGGAMTLLEDVCAAECASKITYNGVAVPHVRVPDFNDLHVIIATLEQPVQLQPQDTAPTQVVVMSLIGGGVDEIYLRAIGALVRFFAVPEALDKFVAASTPQAVLALLDHAGVMLKKTITAEDVMDAPSAVLTPESTVAEALDIFNCSSRVILPVVNQDGRLLGEVDSITLLRHFVPEYVFMMESSGFMANFEPFDRIFREQHTERIGRFMTTPPRQTIAPDLPLLQVTIAICKCKVFMFFVVDAEGRLLGEISVKNIVQRVLRG